MSVRRWTRRTTHYTPLLWRNLQRLEWNCMVHTPPLEHDITTCPSKGTWLPISVSEIGSCEEIRCHPSSSWHLTTNMNPYFAPSALSWTSSSLDPYIVRASSLRLPFTSPMSWHPQPFSNADVGVGIRETTQGDFDLQWTTQHVLFRSLAHWLWLICHDATLGTATKIQDITFDSCRVFEGTKTIPKPLRSVIWIASIFLRSSRPWSHSTDSTRSRNNSTLH